MLVLARSLWLWRRCRGRGARTLVALIAAGYALYVAYAVAVWL